MIRRLLCIALAIGAIQGAFAEFFIIDTYDLIIRVDEANRYYITETIDVTFSEPRHGIFRDIPTRYYGRPALVEHVSVENHESLLQEGAGNLRIRIGNPNEYVDGRQRYVIKYEYQLSEDPYRDMDELYFNLIGDSWTTSIGRVSFRIDLPKPFDPSPINFTYGPFGSVTSADVEYDVTGTVISGMFDDGLDAYEAFTIALPLPEGYFSRAEPTEYLSRKIFRPIDLPVDLILIALAFLFWYLWGRDNPLTTVVEYRPPDGLTPAEIGYIIDGNVDSKDVTSLIIYLAEKGYLTIDVEDRGRFKSDMTLTKVMEISPEEPKYVEDLFSALFDTYGTDGVVTTESLKNKFYVHVGQLQKQVREVFTKDPDRRVYEKQRWYVHVSLFLLAVFAVVKTVHPVIYELTLDGAFAVVGSGLVSVFAIAGMTMLASVFGNAEGFPGGIGVVKIIMGLVFGIAPFAVVFIASGTTVRANPVFFVAALVTVFMMRLFAHLMKNRTEYGDEIVGRVLGLREFIRTAEADRIQTLFDQNPSYYFRVLPYAIVLGESDKWARHFANLSVEPPHWYRSDRLTRFSVHSFQESLDRSFTSMNYSMTSSPSSSSSSSGGSSGGGGGGGGGGSW